MSYAGSRRIIDADSHLIELEDFVANAADPIRLFEKAMPDCDQEMLDRFYYRNMEELMGTRSLGTTS
jgi:hypothetical protein